MRLAATALSRLLATGALAPAAVALLATATGSALRDPLKLVLQQADVPA